MLLACNTQHCPGGEGGLLNRSCARENELAYSLLLCVTTIVVHAASLSSTILGPSAASSLCLCLLQMFPMH